MRPTRLSAEREEMGGLSGPPLRPFALQALRRLRSLLPASVPIIGCGGITTGADALEFARAGATTVQIYTSFGYEGVGAPRRLKDEIAAELQKAGTTWRDASRDAVEKHASVEPEKPKEDLDLLAKESLDLKLMLDNLEPEFEGQGVLGLVEADQVLDAAPTGNVGMAGEHDERQLLDNVAPAILEALPHSEEGIDVQEGRLSDGSASTDVELRGDSGSI